MDIRLLRVNTPITLHDSVLSIIQLFVLKRMNSLLLDNVFFISSWQKVHLRCDNEQALKEIERVFSRKNTQVLNLAAAADVYTN